MTGVAWAVLLLGLWLWGRDGQVPGAVAGPAAGDVAAAGSSLGAELPPSRTPLESTPGAGTPRRVEIPSLGIEAPVVPRGLDASGAVDPPPYSAPDTVGWYGAGVRPGAEGAAILVGHVDTQTEPAVFYGLSSARTGEKIRVTRTDGKTAEFTIDDVQVVDRDRFDAKKVYGAHERSRAELRLITCGGTFDRTERAYTANVVVSAYLTGVR
ncbi:class F sortase [Streptomyces sp. NPDC056987]|uniref:class F sortase n=1 Tax=Streptomyces sp. NPDC056987 TaxID=3345988 RepID=UPI003640F5B1